MNAHQSIFTEIQNYASLNDERIPQGCTSRNNKLNF